MLLSANSWKGTKEATFALVAQALDVSYKAGQRFSFASLEKYVRAGHPVLVSYIEPADNSGHYSIVVEAKASGVCLRDPLSGKDIFLGKRDFLKRWQGQFHKTYHFAIVFKKL